MDSLGIKEELKQRIDSEDTPIVLNAIKELLFPEESDPIYIEKLISRTLEAEKDIEAGRVYTSEEFKSKLDELFAKLAKRK